MSLRRRFLCLAMVLTTGLLYLAPRATLASCYPMAGLRPTIIPASFRVAAAPWHHVRITFIGHSSFEIETAEAVRVVTDFSGYVSPDRLPQIVTMNNAHGSHYTDFVPDRIKYVMRGWDPEGGIARHNVKLRDLRVRNVPTNLADMGGGKLANGNSIFVFESAGLCIAHISHLHHMLSKDQMRDLGRVDIAFAAIDGMWTMSHDELFEVMGQVKPMLVIPMHYGSLDGVDAFIARAEKQWKIRHHPSPSIELSFRDLPRRTQVLFLQGY